MQASLVAEFGGESGSGTVGCASRDDWLCILTSAVPARQECVCFSPRLSSRVASTAPNVALDRSRCPLLDASTHWCLARLKVGEAFKALSRVTTSRTTPELAHPSLKPITRYPAAVQGPMPPLNSGPLTLPNPRTHSTVPPPDTRRRTTSPPSSRHESGKGSGSNPGPSGCRQGRLPQGSGGLVADGLGAEPVFIWHDRGPRREAG